MSDTVKIFNSDRDDLFDYAQRVMGKTLMTMQTPLFGLEMFGSAACLVLDREGQFQAELCIFPPGIPIPHHLHPDVDSIEIQITGSLHLYIEGKNIMRGADFDKMADLLQKVGFRIPANADHNVEIGDKGAVFLSVQRWNKGQPDHVGYNWRGVAYSGNQEVKNV